MLALMKTHKKRLFIFSGLVILLAAVLIRPINTTAGEGPTLRSILGWKDTPTPVVEAPQFQAPAELPTPSKEEIMTSRFEALKPSQTSGDQLNRNEEIIAQLERLITEANERYTLPGWWHTFRYKETFITASASFPNGDPVPTQSTVETWKFIDADGYIDKLITSQDTGDPLTSTTSVYKDGVVTMYGTNESREKEKSLARDTSLLNELESNKDIIVLEMNEVLWQGVKTLAFSYTYRHSPLDSNPELSQEEEENASVIGTTIGTVYTHYVSVEDGYFVGYEVSFIYPGEQVKLASRTIVKVYEHVDEPPSEIFAYFD